MTRHTPRLALLLSGILIVSVVAFTTPAAANPLTNPDITGTNSPVAEGDDLTVTASVENDGTSTAEQSVSLEVGGVVRDATSITLAPGESTSVTLEWQTASGDAGDYTATVSTPNKSASTSVTVEAAPVIHDLSYAPGNPTTDDAVEFSTNASVTGGTIEDYTWRVNGTTVADTRTFEYTFDAAASHNVSVTVTDDSGTSATRSTQVDVTAGNVRPTVDIEYTPADPVSGDTVSFTANASDPDGSIFKYRWWVNGAFVGSNQDMQYTFNSTGEHRVAVVVTDDDGGSRSDGVILDIGTANLAPNASGIELSPDEVVAGESVTLTADASDPDGTIESYQWTVDGATVGGGETLSYAFETAGTHVVGLTVVDDAGATAGVERSVDVVEPNQPPSASAAVSPSSLKVGEEVTLVASASDADGQVTSYEWSVGGDVVATGQTATHTFQSAGDHAVVLTVTDDEGATATAEATVSVAANQPPTVTIGDVGGPTAGEQVSLSADASDPDGEVQSYEWTVDGEVVSSARTFTYTFESAGEYEVAVTVTDGDGATTSASQTVTVEAAPTTTTPGDGGSGGLIPGFTGGLALIALLAALATVGHRRR